METDPPHRPLASPGSSWPMHPTRPQSQLQTFLSRLRQEIKQPSVFSTSPGSNADTSDHCDDPGLVPGTDTLRLQRSRSRCSNVRIIFNRANSSRYTEGEVDEDEAPVSRIIVNGDLGCIGVDQDDASTQDGASISGHEPSHGRVNVSKDYTSRALKRTEGMPDAKWLWKIWKALYYFFDMSFAEKSAEKSFKEEQYYAQRQLSIAAAFFFLLAWVLYCALTPTPYGRLEFILYLGVYGVFTLPILPMVLLNVPYRNPWLWQIWLAVATWILPDISIIQIKLCGFYQKDNISCSDPTELVALASAIGQSTLAILALGQTRLTMLLAFGQFFSLTGGLLFHGNTPSTLYRDVVYFLLFHLFLLGINFLSERSSRQLFEVREQLKLQYKATQKAQIMEKKASDLTKRFVSYIFHEVRVPLNTALLSVQNLEGENLFDCFTDDQREMVHGLTNSLAMMEKVLNDVLSFNRMESGTFKRAKAPFDLHKSIRLTVLSHSSPAHMKGLILQTNLDPKVDQLGCRFIGDEMRLQQITSNLVSNAIKFTHSGSVKIVTKLLCANVSNRLLRPASHHQGEPHNRAPLDISRTVKKSAPTCDPERGDAQVEEFRNRPAAEGVKTGTAVVRIEVCDTGAGLRDRDLADDRLFSPYVQTELGRRQGGKGTGLGLALVRQIVQLSNGRLGVESQYGKGSVIWFEMPYTLGDAPCTAVSRGCAQDLPAQVSTVTSSTTWTKGTLEDDLARREGFYVLKPRDDFSVDTEEMTEAEQKLVPPPPTAASIPLGPVSLEKAFDDVLRARSKQDDPPQKRTEFTNPVKTDNQTESPLNTATPTAPTPSATPPARGKRQGDALDVLVVDDDKLTRLMMARMIVRLGHQVNTAENGREALEKITDAFHLKEDATPVDVVFLDNQMPLMTGVETTSRIRALGSPLFIVGCTGNALRSDQEEYFSAGVDCILTKPIKQSAVEGCILEARKRLAGENLPKIWERRSTNGVEGVVK